MNQQFVHLTCDQILIEITWLQLPCRNSLFCMLTSYSRHGHGATEFASHKHWTIFLSLNRSNGLMLFEIQFPRQDPRIRSNNETTEKFRYFFRCFCLVTSGLALDIALFVAQCLRWRGQNYINKWGFDLGNIELSSNFTAKFIVFYRLDVQYMYEVLVQLRETGCK